MTKKTKTRDIAVTILKLLAVGSCVLAVTTFPGLAILFKNSAKDFKPYKEHSFRKSLWYLKRNKMISVKTKNRKSTIAVSEYGKKHLHELQYKNIQIVPPKKWDYKWRLVVFDIPEPKKLARDSFRRKLKRMNFYSLQKSIYVYPFPCKTEVNFIQDALEIRPYVYYLTSPYNELPSRVNQYFKKINFL